ncbi:reverse transcriptase domain-containing protein [Tanacetum coccineum]
MTNLTDMLSKIVNANIASSSGTGSLPSNTVTNPKEDLKGITTRSGVAYQGPMIPTTTSSPKNVQPSVVQDQPHVPNSEPIVAPVSAPVSNLKPTILYPSRRNDERRREKANDQIEKFYEIFKDLSFKISLTDALILMPKFASNLKSLIGNKEKLSEMARTQLNEHCSRVVDFDADPRVPLILGRSFLKTGRALIDVYEGELTLRVGKEAVTFNLDQTSRYSSNYDDMTANRIDVIEMACEEYSQEVLGFSDVISSGNPTPYYDPIVSTSSPTLTPFGDSDFLLEEVDAFLALDDDPTSPEVDDSYYDPEGDILLLEAYLNDDPSPPPNQGNYLPEIRKELKVCEAKTDKSSIDEPPEVELKDLPPHLEYAFLEGDDKLPVIIAKDLSMDEKAALIKVLKSRKRAIAWKLSDIKGWHVCIDYRKLNEATRKDHFPLPFMDQMLERLAGNDYYCFLDGFFLGLLSNSIDPHDQRKETIQVLRVLMVVRLPSHCLSVMNAPAPGINCLSCVDKMLKRCKDTNLCLNWEKSHFMVKEGIVIGHKISNIWDLRPIHYASKTLSEAELHYTTTEKEMLAVVYAFEKFRSYLILNKSIMYTDHSALKYLFAKKDSKARLLRVGESVLLFNSRIFEDGHGKFKNPLVQDRSPLPSLSIWHRRLSQSPGQTSGLSRIFKASRARGFVLRSLELQNPQLHLGNPIF